MAYSHEKLVVYQEALKFTEWVADHLKPALMQSDPRLADQISRASQSVILNISEGSGRWLSGDKRRFYQIARASAAECSAALDIIRVSSLYDIGQPDWFEAADRLEKISIWMLRLIVSVEKTESNRRNRRRG